MIFRMSDNNLCFNATRVEDSVAVLFYAGKARFGIACADAEPRGYAV